MAGSQGRTFFEYLDALPGPLRVGPLQEFTRSIGLEEFRSPVALTAFMATPTLHQGCARANTSLGGVISIPMSCRSQPAWDPNGAKAPPPAAATGFSGRKARRCRLPATIGSATHATLNRPWLQGSP